MSVNESILEEKIKKLNDLDRILNLRRRKIIETIDSLNSIRKTDHADSSQKSNKLKMPKDRATGKEMRQSRRQEIYDACIPVADQLLGEAS